MGDSGRIAGYSEFLNISVFGGCRRMWAAMLVIIHSIFMGSSNAASWIRKGCVSDTPMCIVASVDISRSCERVCVDVAGLCPVGEVVMRGSH